MKSGAESLAPATAIDRAAGGVRLRCSIQHEAGNESGRTASSELSSCA